VKEENLFEEVARIAHKTQKYITFTILIQMERTKASHLDENITTRKKILKFLFQFVVDF